MINKTRNSPIKILCVYFFGKPNGYEPGWYRFDLFVEILKKRGYNTWILGYKRKTNNIKESIFGHTKIDERNKVITLIKPRWFAIIDTLLYNFLLIDGFAYSILLLNVCKKMKFDTVILADDTIGINFYFLSLSKLFLREINIIIDYQDLTARLHTYKSRNFVKRLISIIIDEIINPKLAGKLITVTNYRKRYMKDKTNIKNIYVISEMNIPKRKFLILNKEECRKILALPNKRIIIWTGRLGGQTTQDVMLLLKALTLCKTKDIKIIIIGSGDLKSINLLKTYAKENNIDLTMTGYISSLDDKYWLYLRAADVGIFLRPNSDYAHFLTGRKVSDYYSVGLPVIVPCLKGQLETLKGNGLCYEPDNAQDLANKIDEIFKLDLEELGRNSLKIAKEMLSPSKLEEIILDMESKGFFNKNLKRL